MTEKEGGEGEELLHEGGTSDTAGQSIKKGVRFEETKGEKDPKKTNEVSIAAAASILAPEAGTTMEFMRESLKDLKLRVHKINNQVERVEGILSNQNT